MSEGDKIVSTNSAQNLCIVWGVGHESSIRSWITLRKNQYSFLPVSKSSKKHGSYYQAFVQKYDGSMDKGCR